MKNTTGFTLIELLIVIAIIGILATFLLPNLLAAQKRAYDVSALGCANSLVKAVSVYRVDHPEVAATPPLTTFYGNSTAEEEYGTNNCAGLTLQDLSQNPDYKFIVKHPAGNKTFTVTSSGVVGS